MNVASGSDEVYQRPPGSGGSSTRPYQQKAFVFNIETMRLQLSSLAARVQSRVSVDTLRPLPMFLGLTATGLCLSPHAFTPPVKKVDKTTLEKIKSRVKLNLSFFLSNYVLIGIMVAVVVALMHPGMVLFVGLVYGLWSLHGFLLRNQLVIFGISIHSLLTVQQRFYVLFAITSLVVVLKCLGPTLIFLTISTLLIMSHALLRDPKDVESFGSEHPDDDSDADMDDLEGAVVGGGGGGGGNGGSSSGDSSEVLVERPSSATTKPGSGTSQRRSNNNSN